MFQFPGCPSAPLCVHGRMRPLVRRPRVSPFGHPRIAACARLPEAFRSVPRPSSAPGAKASTLCSSSLHVMQRTRFCWCSFDAWPTVDRLLRCLSQGAPLPRRSACCGDEGIRTPDLRRAKAALSQLSYIPAVGLSGLEPETSPLSEARSNQLS